jgi:hypothetical protein
MMYHDYRFGKAYQEEMLREAGVKDIREFEGTIQRRVKGQGLLRRMIGRWAGRKVETKSASPVSIQKAGHTLRG